MLDAAQSPRPGLSRAYVAALVGEPMLERIAGRLGVPLGPDPRIDFVDAWKILHANVETIGDEGHRLSNQSVPNGNFELLVASMLQGENLADGLRRMAEGARILRPDLTFAYAAHGGRPHLSVRFASGETLARAIYVEALVTVLHCAVCWAVDGDAQIVRLRGPALVDPQDGSWLELLGPPAARRGAGATVVYAAASGAAPFKPRLFARWHDAAFAQYVRLATALDGRCRRPQGETARLVREALAGGLRGQDAVARRLGMSPATLRRRLQEDGASFRSLHAELMRDAAQVLLLGDKSSEEIAAELGLSDSRCFRRACQAWFGGSPTAVRQAFRAAARRPQIA